MPLEALKTQKQRGEGHRNEGDTEKKNIYIAFQVPFVQLLLGLYQIF